MTNFGCSRRNSKQGGENRVLSKVLSALRQLPLVGMSEINCPEVL